MLGCYDFCGHYEWTFEWLRRRGGEPLVRRYWDEAIYRDSQGHATALIHSLGFDGMAKYWDHTLVEEGAMFHAKQGEGWFRIDMQECPSKGFLLRNDLEQYHDYCDHCMGWIEPLMTEGGFRVDHEHNHQGQCWWEFRKLEDPSPASAPGMKNDVRLREDWQGKIDVFGPGDKA